MSDVSLIVLYVAGDGRVFAFGLAH